MRPEANEVCSEKHGLRRNVNTETELRHPTGEEIRVKDTMAHQLGAPRVVDRSTFHAELDALRVREKAHTREGDAIAGRPPTAPHGRGGWRHTAHWRARPSDTIGHV